MPYKHEDLSVVAEERIEMMCEVYAILIVL